MAAGGIHPDDETPFLVPWSRAPAGEIELGVLRYHWRTRRMDTQRVKPDPAVVADGVVVGTQQLTVHDFAVRRKLGYEPNGEALLAVEGTPCRQLLYVLTADRRAESRRGDIEIVGLEPCLADFDAGTES